MKNDENLGFLTGKYTPWNKNVAIQKHVDLKEGDEINLTIWNSDTIDMKIIRHVFSQKTQSFYLDRKISIDVMPIVKDVYGSKSDKYYEEVQDRLLKIKMMRYEMKVKRRELESNGVDLAWFLFNMLYQDHDANKVALVVVNEIVFEQLIIEETI